MGCSNCIKCMSRIPYATLIATVMCCIGVGIFCGTMYRGVTLTLRMIQEVFSINIVWLDAVQLIFVIVGAIMGGLGLVLLLVGFLATGSTREKVYKRWRARLGGRISCAVLMVVTYILHLVWMTMFVCLIIVTLVYALFWAMCNDRYSVQPDRAGQHQATDRYLVPGVSSVQHQKCVDLTQFHFLFPNGTKIESLNVCPPSNLKIFCKDCVEPAGVMFVLATASALLVIISLVQYLACLSANYTHIKDNEKVQDLQEIQYLQVHDMGTLPKERF